MNSGELPFWTGEKRRLAVQNGDFRSKFRIQVCRTR